jgi:hypothetical protein
MSWVQELTELDELKKLDELSSSIVPSQVDDENMIFFHLGWKDFAAKPLVFAARTAQQTHFLINFVLLIF